VTAPAAVGGQASPEPPGLPRRLACLVYEGVLLFGVVMIAGYLYSSLTQQRHALQGKLGLQVFLFVVLGIYFVWFWSHGGQTLAMKTWHLRVQRADGGALTQGRALLRYVLSWVWFVPALLAVHLSGARSAWISFVSLALGVLAYAGLSGLRRDRQFWHDVACDTRLVTWRPPTPAAESGP